MLTPNLISVNAKNYRAYTETEVVTKIDNVVETRNPKDRKINLRGGEK